MIFLTRAEWKSDCGRKHLGIGYIQGVCVCAPLHVNVCTICVRMCLALLLKMQWGEQ